MSDDFDDDISKLFGGTGPVSTPKQPPASYIPLEKRFEEKCPKCRGTGRFISYAGRDCGPCFNCKGAGKNVYKTSPEARATARASSAARAQAKAQTLAGEVTQWQQDHAAAWQWLTSNVARGNEFAKSLTEALYKYGSLTDNQLAAVERQLEKIAARKAEREAAAPAVATDGIDRLKAAFDLAVKTAEAKGHGVTIRSPKITVNGMTIKPAKATSKNPGALYVTAKGTERNFQSGMVENIYLGKIVDGKLFASRDCTPEQQEQILKFVADPAQAAKAYGQETGVCCVCNATLRSEWRLRGIGPICAEKFGW